MKLIEFEKHLKAARSVDEINEILKKYLASFDINTYSFTYYSYHPNSQNKLKYDYATPDFASWHQHYINEHYEEIDSTLDEVYKTVLPTFWDLQQQLKNAKTAREKQMRLDSIEFGAVKGLSIPIHGPQEDFAVLLVVQMKEQKCLDHWQQLQYELFSAAYCYYTYLQKQLLKILPAKEKYQLNKREIQCLTLIAKQYTIEDIAKTLHITERTVNYHIQRLNKKLGTQNKYQSVMKALQKKLILL